jgi:hypothetical protein
MVQYVREFFLAAALNGKSPFARCRANLSEEGRRPSTMQAFNPFPSMLVRFSARNRQTPFLSPARISVAVSNMALSCGPSTLVMS